MPFLRGDRRVPRVSGSIFLKLLVSCGLALAVGYSSAVSAEESLKKPVYRYDDDRMVRPRADRIKATEEARKRLEKKGQEEQISAPPAAEPPLPDKKPADSTSTAPEEELAENPEEAPSAEEPLSAGEETVAAAGPDRVYTVAKPRLEEKQRTVPAVLKVNYVTLESIGTLDVPGDGGMGIDLWDGSRREKILQLIGQLPAPGHYGLLHTLVQRALLTSADARLMEGRGTVSPGEDYQTLRVEKLLDMGAYESAARLYMADHAVPYHERLARAGVQALFLSNQSTIACLETKTLVTRFPDDIFWRQASTICDYLLEKMAGRPVKNFIDRPGVRKAIEGSALMRNVFIGPNYKITPRTVDAFKDFSPLEMALLINDNRISVEALAMDRLPLIPSHILGSLMVLEDIPGAKRLSLRGEAARRGLITPADLGAYYEGLKQPEGGLKKAVGWQRIPAYYVAVRQSKDKAERQNLVREALALADEYGDTPLIAFAPYLSALPAEGLDASALRHALRIMTLAGESVNKSISYEFLSQLADTPSGTPDAYLALSSALGEKFSTEVEQNSDFSQKLVKLCETLPETSKNLVFALYEKLDNGIKLHNSAGENVYVNPDGLTPPDDYVMPSVSLMNDLAIAKNGKRLGEVVLLSAIAIGDAPPETLDPAVVLQVVDGLKAVGLTKEAQELARQVVLSLRN